MTAIPAPTHTASWATTTFTVAGRTIRKLLRTPQVFGIAIVQSVVFLLMFRYVLGGAIGVQRRHLRRVPRPRVRRVRPPLHRRWVVGRGGGGRRVGALRPAALAAHLRPRGARRPGDGRRRADGDRRARDAGRRLHHRLPHEHHGRRTSCSRSGSSWSTRCRFAIVFVWLGLVSGNAQAAQGLSILAVPFSFISSAFVPIATMPGPVQAFAKAQPLTFMVNSWRGLLLGDTVTRTFDHGLVVLRRRLVAVGGRDRRSSSRRSRCARTASGRQSPPALGQSRPPSTAWISSASAPGSPRVSPAGTSTCSSCAPSMCTVASSTSRSST